MTDPARVKVETVRFGAVEVPASACYTFPGGILGFPEVERYILFDNPGGGPLKWLQAVDVPSLAFVCCDPALFLPGYRVEVRKEDLAEISLQSAQDGYVLVILVIGKEPTETTANLLGPVVLNLPERLGKQLVLSDSSYSARHPVMRRRGA